VVEEWGRTPDNRTTPDVHHSQDCRRRKRFCVFEKEGNQPTAYNVTGQISTAWGYLMTHNVNETTVTTNYQANLHDTQFVTMLTYALKREFGGMSFFWGTLHGYNTSHRFRSCSR
jgi:hypothetical protein